LKFLFLYFKGENGKAVDFNLYQLSKEEKKQYEEGIRITSYNEYVSDLISTRRRLPDYRDQK